MSRFAIVLNLAVWGVATVLLILKIAVYEFSWWWVAAPIIALYGIAIILGVFFGLYDDYQAVKHIKLARKNKGKK